MTHPPPFLEEPDDTGTRSRKRHISRSVNTDTATSRSSGSGTRFSKSKSLLYHHYDSKDDLLLDFLEFMLDQLEEQVPTYQEGEPTTHRKIVDSTFSFGEMHPSTDFAQALVELRTQAAHDEDYREYFTWSDRFVRKHIVPRSARVSNRAFSGGGSTGNGSALPDRVLRNDDPARNQ